MQWNFLKSIAGSWLTAGLVCFGIGFGVHWFLSSTSPPRESITIKAGRTVRVEVDDAVHFTCRARRKDDRMQLGFAIKGADGRGLSVYKNDRRVPVTYKVLAKDGKVMASGTMNYG